MAEIEYEYKPVLIANLNGSLEAKVEITSLPKLHIHRFTSKTPADIIDQININRTGAALWYGIGAIAGTGIGLDGMVRFLTGLTESDLLSTVIGTVELIVSVGFLGERVNSWRRGENADIALKNYVNEATWSKARPAFFPQPTEDHQPTN